MSVLNGHMPSRIQRVSGAAASTIFCAAALEMLSSRRNPSVPGIKKEAERAKLKSEGRASWRSSLAGKVGLAIDFTIHRVGKSQHDNIQNHRTTPNEGKSIPIGALVSGGIIVAKIFHEAYIHTYMLCHAMPCIHPPNKKFTLIYSSIPFTLHLMS